MLVNKTYNTHQTKVSSEVADQNKKIEEKNVSIKHNQITIITI